MIRANGGYNSEALGQVAANIAQMFAPPSGSDLAGYSTARVNNQKAKTAEQLAQMALDDANFNQAAFDRLNVAGGNYNPTQSYYAQDQNNSTAMRGQDVTAATTRANNFDDNRTDLVTEMYGSRDPYHNQPALPQTIAESFGLPGIPAMPGQPKPLSQTEVLGGQTQRLIDDGQIGDEDLKTLIMKGTDGTAAEDRIGRIAHNLQATGDVLDPTAAYDLAVGIVDGRLKESRHPVTGEVVIIDLATGRPAHQPRAIPRAVPGDTGDPVIDAVLAPPRQFGQPYPDAGGSFGVGGAAAGAINTVTDTLGLGVAYPEVQSTQADFKVLRERLLSDMEDSYGGRQPPSWLMQEIRNLTPDAGNPLEGTAQAQAKLTAIGRQMENQLALVVQQLRGELTPMRRQELEAQVNGLQMSVGNISQALSSFGNPSAGGPAGPAAPVGVDPADWDFMTDEQKALFNEP